MHEKINLAEKLALLEKPYEPGTVGVINDYKLQVVKVKGPFVWHQHDETDDFFLVISGRLTIHLRDRDVELDPGEIFVVPRGVEHCPDAEEETQVLLIEPRDTVNTGDAGGDMTAEPASFRDPQPHDLSSCARAASGAPGRPSWGRLSGHPRARPVRAPWRGAGLSRARLLNAVSDC